MNRLLLLVLSASFGLAACSNNDVTAAPGAPAAQSATPVEAAHSGKIVQLQQAGSYTYAEVDTGGGQKVWVAGGHLEAKAGDSVQWTESAVMTNFQSKTLNRTFDKILFVTEWSTEGGPAAQVAPHGADPAQAGVPAGHPPMAGGHPPMGEQAAPAGGSSKGSVKSVAVAGGYSYLEIDQGGTTVWLAAPETPVKVGDTVTWNGGMPMSNFNAKSLNRVFDSIIFASAVSVVR